MTLFYVLLSILLGFICAVYQQLPTFILALGYRWSHNIEIKRWILRILALGSFVLFLSYQPAIWEIIPSALLLSFFLVFSLLNANPNVFRALDADHILKSPENQLDPIDEVIGYINGNNQAICYPVEVMIKPRHLLNDVFKNEKILISFCAACRSSIVYSRILEGQELHFQVIGVYRRNMIMRDKETGTIWQQGTGEAVYGKLKGNQLTLLPYQQMMVRDWLKLYPDSLIATESKMAPLGLFSKARLIKMLEVTERLVAPGKTELSGLPLREKIWGLEINGAAKAYPVCELKKVSNFTDQLGEVLVEVRYTASSNLITGKEIKTGQTLKFQSHWWFGWKEFHPHTEIWKAR
jgi:hypothetical protein